MRTVTSLLVLANLSLAHAGVLTVGGPGAAYTDLQTAVNAAVDGDVLLVRMFAPTPVTVDGKGISIVADTTTHLPIWGEMVIRNVPAGSTMLVAGFYVSWINAPGVSIQNCAGSVRLQDLVTTVTNSAFLGSQPVVSCTNAADVAITRCTLHGQDGYSWGYSGGAAVVAQSSNIAIYDSTVTGGHGGNGHIGGQVPTDGLPGGTAIGVVNSVVFASGCVLTGGDGGNGVDGGVPPPTCITTYQYPTYGGDGGSCVGLWGGSTGNGFANVCTGGASGIGGVSPCGQSAGNGIPGRTYDPTGLPWNEAAGTARTMSMSNLVRESTTLLITFHGVPGDRVYLTSSPAPAHDASALLGGVFLVHAPYRRVSPGFLDASGTLTMTLPMSALPAGVDEDARHYQCVMSSASGQLHLGSSAVVTRLDSAY